jgi:hypothetical protein
MAGVIYLNPNEMSMDTGTSVCYDDGTYTVEEDLKAVPGVREFNQTSKVSEEYKKVWKENKDRFPETIRAANIYNRLVAYDGYSFHRTNSFAVSSGEERLTLLFYVTEYEYGN